jgi:hypothetical protein
MDSKYSLILSRGTHAISEEQAGRITEAISERRPWVDVELDYFGDGLSLRMARIMTQHVIMLVENTEATVLNGEHSATPGGKIRAIRG